MPATHAITANIVTDATDWLDDVSSNWWFLLVIALIAFLDSVFPVVPGETSVIIGGVAAGQGHYSIVLVIAAGAIGAFLGDNLAYLIGDKMSGMIERQAAKREKWQFRLDWAERQIRTRGGMLLITARFIPGGRTALTVSSGVTHQPHMWFMGWVAVATTIWATYAALLGFVGGKAFEDNHTAAFLVAFGLAIGATLVIELVRHLRERAAGAVEHPDHIEG